MLKYFSIISLYLFIFILFPYAAKGFEEKTVTVNGHEHFFIEEGVGETVIFLHGVPTSSVLYRNIVPRVAAGGFHAIALDLLGFGRSDKPIRFDYTFTNYIDLLEAFMDELGIDQATLVVHDVGGMFGIGFAIERMERVSSLVILDTSIWRLDLPPLPTIARIPVVGRLFFSQTQFDYFMKIFIAVGIFDQDIVTDAFIDMYQEPYLKADARNALLQVCGSFQIRKFLEWQEQLATLAAIPVTIIWGENDLFLKTEIAERFHSEIPGSTLHIVPEARHFLQEDKPEVVSDLILEFLNAN